MLTETLASLYEEMRNYTRGTDISTPMAVLFQIVMRYAMENRIGLVLDRNFDAYIQMARNLENPYHLYGKKELKEFLADMDEALQKDGYDEISDMLELVPFMYDEKEWKRFNEILGTKAFRSTYENFLKEDFRDGSSMDSLPYTLSYQARKDLRDHRSYSLGTMLSKALELNAESMVVDELENSEFMLSAIALSSSCRIITEKKSLLMRMLSPLSMRKGSLEKGEKNALLLSENLPKDLESALQDYGKIAYFAPSALLLSSSRENLETRKELISSGRIESVMVLPPLSTSSNESTTILILNGKENDHIGFADLNSRSKDRNYAKDNQLTENAIEVLSSLLQEEKETDGISRCVSYGEVREKKILVPMNYLESKVETELDTEEIEKRIDTLYGKLAALMEL